MAEAKSVYRRNKKNEVSYIYLDEPYWNIEAKMGRHRMKCIGKVSPDTMNPIRHVLRKNGQS